MHHQFTTPFTQPASDKRHALDRPCTARMQRASHNDLQPHQSALTHTHVSFPHCS